MGFNELRKQKVETTGGTSVHITGPLTTFGELSIAELTPVAQGDFVYNINTQIFSISSFAAGAQAIAQDGMCNLSSGTDASGSATVQLRRGLKYKSGQGSLMRATALFDAPSAGNAQFIGAGNSECGYFIGYFGDYFGILHQANNKREIRKLTVTTAAIVGNVIITLDGTSISVPVNSTTTYGAAYQISKALYNNLPLGGWLTDVVGSDVYFLTARSRVANGTYSAIFGGSPIGTFSPIQAGIQNTPDFIPSGSFSIDKMDGSGPSAMVLNPQHGNVYQIGFQYLGFGNAKFYAEDPNTGKLHQFHEIKNANNRTFPVLNNPNVSVLATSANIGGTTSKVLKTASMAAFVEGRNLKLDPKYSATWDYSINSATYVPIGLLKTNRVHNLRSSFGEFDLLRINLSNEVNNKTVTVGLFIRPQISGPVNYIDIFATQSIVSKATLDPAINTITNLATNPPFYEIVCSPQSSIVENLEVLDFVFGPGVEVLVAIKSTAAAAGSISVGWYEQQ